MVSAYVNILRVAIAFAANYHTRVGDQWMLPEDLCIPPNGLFNACISLPESFYSGVIPMALIISSCA